MTEEKKTNRDLLLAEFGNYCLDISKLVFGGIILAGIMELKVSKLILFGIGAVIVLLTAITGFTFIKLSNSKKE